MYDVVIVEDNKAIELCSSVDLNYSVSLCASIFERAQKIHLRILDSSSKVCVVKWCK